MFNVNGQVYVTNLKEVSPRLVVGDVYCHEKLNENEYNTTFVKAKFVGEALAHILMTGIKNKDKVYIEKSILKANKYKNKEGKEVSNLELTVFKTSTLDNQQQHQKGNRFDR